MDRFDRACFASHMGAWVCEPSALAAGLDLLRAGQWPVLSGAEVKAEKDRPIRDTYQVVGGIAVFALAGPLTKGISKLGNTTSMMRTADAVLDAAGRKDVVAGLMHTDSPGGMVPGVTDLVDAVRAFARRKPMDAFAEDQSASGAFWVNSAADHIWANRGALVGSIGVFTVLEDLSGLAEAKGIKIERVATGPRKGLGGVPGEPITDDLRAMAKERITDVAAIFYADVAAGRGMTQEQMDAATTGDAWVSSRAEGMGLIDGVRSLDAVMAGLLAEADRRKAERRTAESRAR